MGTPTDHERNVRLAYFVAGILVAMVFRFALDWWFNAYTCYELSDSVTTICSGGHR